MSTDYIAACRTCEVQKHLGQQMAGRRSLGYGSGDADGADSVLAFLFEHAGCDGDLVVLEADNGLHEPEYAYAQDPGDL